MSDSLTDMESTLQEPSNSKRWIIGGGSALALSLVAILGYSNQTSGINSHLNSPHSGGPPVVVSDGNDIVRLDEAQGNDVKSHSTRPPIVESSGNDVVKITKTLSSVSSSPNIFLFTIDDMGWNDMGYNSGDISEATPYMKSLAKKGITLTHYYSQPSCTPSRVTLMTGKFAYKNGFQNYELQHSDGLGVPLSNKMMPAYMKDLGYKTIGYGKWNIGHCNSKYLPHERGFDHYLGYLCPGHGYSDHNCGTSAGYRDMIEGWATKSKDGTTTNYEWTNGSPYLGTYDTLIYKEETQKALRKHFSDDDAKPMFMWLAQHGMHSEYDSDPIPPSELLTSNNKEYLKVLKKRLDDAGSEQEGYSQFFKMRMITASVLMSLDNTLKNLIETLDDIGELPKSVIFVNSDNGGDTLYTKGHPGNNYPLRSEKFSYYEGGVRVPAFVYAPGMISAEKQNTKYHGLMHHVDLIATFYELGGGDTDDLQKDSDSLSQWSAIMGDTTSPRSEVILNLPRSRSWKIGESQTSEGAAIRMGNYKMLLNHAYDSWFSPSTGEDFHSASAMIGMACEYSFYSTGGGSSCVFGNYLFNILEDPTEKNNLWDMSEYNDIKISMIKRIETIVAEQTNNYGTLVPETYEKAKTSTNNDYQKAFAGNDDYVVPWDCDVIY